MRAVERFSAQRTLGGARAALATAALAALLVAPVGPLERPGIAAEPDAYARLLAMHVRPGTVDGIRLNLVDYAALAKDPAYREALRDLAAARPSAMASADERFAFWVNAYNLLAIKTVVDRYPIDGIKDGGSLFSPIWKKKVGTVAGEERSLDEIEHGILRAEFQDPRVHFAVVCASLSCPDLRREPYVAARLAAQLDEQTRDFLGNQSKGLVPGPGGETARVSSIFKWFGEDFAPAGGVAAFIEAKAPPEVAQKISGLDEDGISYLDYDWSLNDTARAR